MSNGTPFSLSILVVTMIVMGLVSGSMYFRMLRRTVTLLVGERGWWRAAMLTVARHVGAIIILFFMARYGALALIGGFSGFLLARMAAMHAMRRAE